LERHLVDCKYIYLLSNIIVAYSLCRFVVHDSYEYDDYNIQKAAPR